MTQRREEIEAFVRHLVAEAEAAEAEGMVSPQAIADHFNGKGLTTRKGRGWTGVTVAKFLSSPGAKRYRTGGNVGSKKFRWEIQHRRIAPFRRMKSND